MNPKCVLSYIYPALGLKTTKIGLSLTQCFLECGNIIHILKNGISTSVATVLKWLYPYVQVIGVWWFILAEGLNLKSHQKCSAGIRAWLSGENIIVKYIISLVNVGHNYWHPIIVKSFSQGNSSEFSPEMPEEFGEHLIRDQRLFSSYRISPDPSDSQLHVSTSLQFTPFIFWRVQVRGQGQPW